MTAPAAPRFLIDENLSPLLAMPARARGFEAMHVNHLNLRTETDWALLRAVASQDWVLVTNNAIEFRGRYREIELHPGVVFLLPAVRREAQLRLFEAVLDHVQRHPDLVNTALDAAFDEEGAARDGVWIAVADAEGRVGWRRVGRCCASVSWASAPA